MKIAIVGTGISGLTTAYYLTKDGHEVELFEANDYIGGHTATVDVEVGNIRYAIDTGFIVYNDWTYPNFIKLMTELGVASQPTRMGFSVSCEETGLEYAGQNLDTLFAQRRNLANPYFLRLLWDIVRFNKSSVQDLEEGVIDESTSLGDYLERQGYGKGILQHYLVPMGSAIWSASTETMLNFPLKFFVRFFKNHGLLNIKERPQWRVIQGGSRNYIPPLTASFKDRIHLNTPVESIQRHPDRVDVKLQNGQAMTFDQVVLACHSDQAEALLHDETALEESVLGAMAYQSNEVVLHTDINMLPARRKAWSSWNYQLDSYKQDRAVLTYNMNILQGLHSPETFCVTLNNTAAIDRDKILREFNYSHPVFTLESVAAQERWAEINGVNRTWFCGAYWRNGFHEDGVYSALRVVEGIQKETNDAERNLSRVRAA